MRNNFSTSVNILRDSKKEIGYISTPNSESVANQIAKDYYLGLRSFNIIGSYGTGKSAFLWAFQQSLGGRKKHFSNEFFYGKKCGFINIIGDYSSFTEAVAESLGIKPQKSSTENILSCLFDKYHDLGKKDVLLVILVDEFGKFLEYASQNNAEKELYFIQQLTEFVNNSDLNILLITTVHQNIDAYGYGLSVVQRNEWTKVKGRFRELPFNEPVEQLLYLASQYFGNRVYSPIESKKVSKAKKIAIETRSTGLKGHKIEEVSNSLYPLDILSANALVLSLQRYGQNERSLFSFLESTDNTGLRGFNSDDNPFYNLACIYDYIAYNFYSFINSRHNSDFLQWSGIKNSLEMVERTFIHNPTDYLKIVKAIGIFSLVAPSGSIFDEKLISEYAKVCLGIENAVPLLKELESKKIVLYRKYNSRYVLFEGTDLDIQLALTSATDKIGNIGSIHSILNNEYKLPPIMAKSESYVTGTPRLFEYKISDFPISEKPHDEIDGYINLIFNESLSEDEVLTASLSQKEAVLYCFYKNSKAIKDILFEIEKTKKVKAENLEDKVAARELENVLLHQRNLLSHKILNTFYSGNGDVSWVYNGKYIAITSKKELNKLLSTICHEVYKHTPHFKNELVNKHKISASIHTAKRNYFKALSTNSALPDLGFPKDKYPPEKTIYLSLLKHNGIDPSKVSNSVSSKSSFKHLWEVSEKFLESAKYEKKSLSEFASILNSKPLKLKRGVIDFWIPTFLFLKRDDFALFGSNGFIPAINDEVMEIVAKNPSQYEVKTFDVAGIKLDVFNSYRAFLNQSQKEKVGNSSFIDTIRPFLTFYKQLSDYGKNTKRLSKSALAVRNAISNAKDPEQTFFFDLPSALGYTMDDLINYPKKLKSYIPSIQDAIREIRSSYSDLIERVDDFIQSEFIGEKALFELYKPKLQGRYKNLKRHLLLQNQKTFIARLDSQIEDRTAWLSSLSHALIGKPLEQFLDEDEPVFFDKFKSMIMDLDSLTVLSSQDIDEISEEALAVEIGTFVEGVNKLIVRLPKNKKKDFVTVENVVRANLTNDKALNISVLANILRDLIRK